MNGSIHYSKSKSKKTIEFVERVKKIHEKVEVVFKKNPKINKAASR